jgi:hypothetical protein
MRASARLTVAAVLLTVCVSTLPVQAVAETPPATGMAIAIDAVHMTAAGKFIDLRYRVLDPEVASAQLGSKVRPRLIDERTGSAMAVPTTAKLGSLRQTQAPQKAGRTYFILFANNGSVGPGSKVTAEIGPMTFRHLTVE